MGTNGFYSIPLTQMLDIREELGGPKASEYFLADHPGYSAYQQHQKTQQNQPFTAKLWQQDFLSNTSYKKLIYFKYLNILKTPQKKIKFNKVLSSFYVS